MNVLRTIVAALVIADLLILGLVLTAPAEPAKSSEDRIWAKAPVLSVENIPIDCSAMDTGCGSGEDPNEDAYITAALVAQGYFRVDVPLDYELQDRLHTACERYGVDYALALGAIEVESGFDAEAVGIDGHDIGLFQIRTSNHTDPMTPEGNIECGVWLLGYLLDRCDTTDAALTAYRWGHDNGDRWYAEAVLEAAERWRK